MQTRMPLSLPSNLASTPSTQRSCQVLSVVSLGLVVLVLTGCRGASSVQMDVLEQELRQQEDYIYELEDYLAEYSVKLRRARLAAKQEANQAKSSTKPDRAENFLDDADLEDDAAELPPNNELPPNELPRSDKKRGNQGLNEQPARVPEETTTGQSQAESAEILEPPAPKQAPAPDNKEQPSVPSELQDLEIPELKIEEPNAAHSSRPLQPWSITDTEILMSSVEGVSTSAGFVRIPDPVNYQPPQPTPDDDSRNHQVRHDATLELDDTAAIDRIVIQQLLQNLPNEDRPAEESSSLVGDLPSSRAATPPGSLLAVVEIRDLANEPIDAEGELSLMVMAVSSTRTNADSSSAGKPRRLQRWDFSAEEARAAWQSSPLGDGLHLELPFAPPLLADEPLELWARLVTVDGQKYLTKLPFNLQHLVALQDALLMRPEPDGLEKGSPLPTNGAVRLVDRTMLEEASQARRGKIAESANVESASTESTGSQPSKTQPSKTQWHTARIQSLQPGTAVKHRATTSAKSPRWVAQVGSSRARARHSGISLTPEAAAVEPRMAAGPPSMGGKPTWKSALR